MSRLVIEVRKSGRWLEVPPALEPDLTIDEERRLIEGGGSLSHNGPAGRQLYFFACLGESSVVMRSRGGADVADGAFRVVQSPEGFEEVARLTVEQPSFECFLKPDGVATPQRMRWRHEADV